MFNIHERPTGAQLEEFRRRCRVKNLSDLGARARVLNPEVDFGAPERIPTRQEFADSIGVPLETYKQYAKETNGKQMPAQSWTLLRITWDALLLAQWQREHRPKQQEGASEWKG